MAVLVMQREITQEKLYDSLFILHSNKELIPFQKMNNNGVYSTTNPRSWSEGMAVLENSLPSQDPSQVAF